MTDIIHLLPDNVANQIAAGEVVQRPASVVKELLENSVDAQATEIKLLVKDSGRTLVQVIDNGKGMSETDARMSFERHATSKLKDINDLFSLRTMGFRGEALASIASVAQVEMKTKRDEDELATLIQVDGSVLKKQELCQFATGTSIAVKNIFFNVPARRQFLKSDSAEMRHIIDEVFRVALINPKIKFEVYHNDKIEHSLLPNSQKQRIIDVLGKNLDKALIALEYEMPQVKISGFIGKPEFAAKTKGDQYFFINNRFIKYPYLHHAIMQVYDEFVKDGKTPPYVLHFDIDPKNIDINIHPTKTEVKFADEKMIYGVLLATVRKALGISNVKPSIDFNLNDSIFPQLHQNNNSPNSQTREEQPYLMNNFGNKGNSQPSQSYLDSYRQMQETPDLQQKLMFEDADEDNLLKFFQFKDFIVAGMVDKIIVVNHQFAHERIFYEKFLQKLNNSQNEQVAQTKLYPQTVEFSPSNADVAIELKDSLLLLGWDIEQIGKFSFAINSAPPDVKEDEVKDLLFSMLENYKNNLLVRHTDRNSNLALSLAKSLAHKCKSKLTETEQRQVLEDLFETSNPQISPSGKTIFFTLTEDEIQLNFD